MEALAMSEVVFLVEEAPEGGYTARALGNSVFTEADSVSELENRVRDAVRCHFEEDERPTAIRLHFVRDHVIAVWGCHATFRAMTSPKPCAPLDTRPPDKLAATYGLPPAKRANTTSQSPDTTL
jgi:hypothetical protein